MADSFPDPILDSRPRPGQSEATAVLAGGCFWCLDAVFRPIDGVLEVTSGYAGGTAETAQYEIVCAGQTNHAEAVRLRYDPAKITYGRLLKVFFWIAHDPTQVNRQGADVGRQYRSAIFHDGPEQQAIAEAYIKQLNAARVFRAPIATTLEPLEAFYRAEAYHQNYAARNPAQPYVAFTAAPKVEKLRVHLGDLLKTRGT